MRYLLSLSLFAACEPETTDPGDWSPTDAAFCALDPAPLATLLGPWRGARIGYALAVVDLDADGFAEVVVATYAENESAVGGMSIHRGGPAGPEATPWVEVEGGLLERVGAQLVALGDVDGDGADDLGVARTTFHPETLGETSVTEVWSSVAGAAPGPTGFEVPGGATLASLDADGDGLGDLVVGDEGTVSLYLGAPGGPSSLVPVTTTNPTPRWALDVIGGMPDLDGDDHDDLLVADDVNRIYLVPGGGLDGNDAVVADVGDLETLAGGDVDGDGLGDWLAGWRNGTRGVVSWFPGLAPKPAVELSGETVDSEQWTVRVAPDLDGDGDDEVLIGARGTVVDGAAGAGQIAVHPGAPSGPAVLPTAVFTASGTGCLLGGRFELGDVDGDGVTDLVARISGNNPLAAEGDAVVVLKGDAGWAR
jgi:FG-GAP repeat